MNEVLGSSTYDEEDAQTYKDILDGKYDKNNFSIYRVFRTEDKMILKCVFIKDGIFYEKDLAGVLDGSALEIG